jgi:glutaconyl-CoA/methylmalonyl-CoA decarboxylase subunit gamma
VKLKITVHGVAYEVEVEVLDPGDGFRGRRATEADSKHRFPVLESRPTETGGPGVYHEFVSPNALPDPREIPRAAHSAQPPVSPPLAPTTASTGGNGVQSPVAGTVMELHCRQGDSVSAGQVVVVVEAMKMNTSITAPLAGRVKTIPVAVGDNVREGQMLVEFE